MEKNNKEYLHLINSEIAPIIEEFAFTNYENAINETFDELKNKLSSYGITYSKLRNVLDSSNKVFAFVFNSDVLCKTIGNINYIHYILNVVIKNIDIRINCVFLGGDLIIENHSYRVYSNIFSEEGIESDELLKSNMCCLVVTGISKHAFDLLIGKIGVVPGYLFSKDITDPNITKYALTCHLIQLNIKYGKYIIYRTPETDDCCNYSGVVNDDSRFKLCPVEECLYFLFLTIRPFQIAAPIKELLYSIRFFKNDFNVKDYPRIMVTDAKVKYINTNKNIKLSRTQIEETISSAIRKNQVFHLAWTGYGESDCLDMNTMVNYENRNYVFALKWNLNTNVISLITAYFA